MQKYWAISLRNSACGKDHKFNSLVLYKFFFYKNVVESKIVVFLQRKSCKDMH